MELTYRFTEEVLEDYCVARANWRVVTSARLNDVVPETSGRSRGTGCAYT
jgi:hypothetical protein